LQQRELKWLSTRLLLHILMKPNPGAGPRQFTVAEAALYLEVHPQTVYDLTAGKKIRSRRKGPRKGRIFFLQCDLDDYLDN
jgi:excisionase family DNA binding protein